MRKRILITLLAVSLFAFTACSLAEADSNVETNVRTET